MPVCDKCGTGLPVGYEYCFKCGYPVRGLLEDEAVSVERAAAAAEPDDAEDRWSTAPPTGQESTSADQDSPAGSPGPYPPTDSSTPPTPPAPPGPALPPSMPPPGYQPPGYQRPGYQPPGYQPPAYPPPIAPPGPSAGAPLGQAGWAPGAYDRAGRPVALVPQGWARRLLAFIIDYFAVSIPVGLVVVVAMALSGHVDLTRQASLNDLLRGQETFFSAGQQTAVVLVMLAVFFVYCLVLEGAWGTTLGKRVLGLRVVREGDFGRCSWMASLIRNAFKVATLVLLPFGAVIPLISMAVDPALHKRVGDRVAHTVVVREVVAPATAWQAPPPPQQPWGGA